MTPQALRRRMAHGNIYPAEKVDASLANYFREGNLGALRELALMWVADRVDEALAVYRETHGIARPWETRERVVVAITGAPGGDDVIRRAARMAARARSQLLGVHIRSADGLRGRSVATRSGCNARSCRSSAGEYHELASADPAGTLVQFAALGERDPDRAWGQSSVALDAPAARFGDHQRAPSVGRHRRPRDLVRPGARRRRARGDRSDARVGRAARCSSPRRRILAWTLAILAPPLLTLLLANLRDTLTLPSDLLMFLLIVVVVAALGGFVPAFVCAITGFLLANWFFTPPYYEFTISEGENFLALVIFLVVGGVVSLLVATASRRTADAARARAEAETLAALSGTLSASDDPLPQLVSQLQMAFDAAPRRRAGRGRPTTRGRSWRRPATRCRRGPTTPTSSSRCTAPRCWCCRATRSATTTARCSRRSPVRWRSRCSSGSCAPTPSAPRDSPRPTSCAPRCSRRSPTTCGRRSRRSRHRCRASCNATSTSRPGRRASCSRPSTRAPIVSTTSSATSST